MKIINRNQLPDSVSGATLIPNASIGETMSVAIAFSNSETRNLQEMSLLIDPYSCTTRSVIDGSNDYTDKSRKQPVIR